MNKDKLVQFIDKYSLNNSIVAVNWKVIASEKVLKSRGELNNKTFVMDVTMKDFTEITEDVRIPIGRTEKVKAMLAPFGENVSLTLNKNGDRVLGFTIADKDCESYCTAAEPNAIPPVSKDITDNNVYDVEISLTDEFVDKFLKAKSALNDVEEFAIKMNKNNQVEVVMGYAVANTNRINLIAPTINGKTKFDGASLRFPAGHIIDVLKANKEMTNGIMYILSKGVMRVVYDSPEFTCNYWQFAQIKK